MGYSWPSKNPSTLAGPALLKNVQQRLPPLRRHAHPPQPVHLQQFVSKRTALHAAHPDGFAPSGIEVPRETLTVFRGFARYHALPTNYRAVNTFRGQLGQKLVPQPSKAQPKAAHRPAEDAPSGGALDSSLPNHAGARHHRNERSR